MNPVPNREGRGSPVFLAISYTQLGDKERALQWLQKAYEERRSYLAFLNVDPEFDPLRSDLQRPDPQGRPSTVSHSTRYSELLTRYRSTATTGMDSTSVSAPVSSSIRRASGWTDSSARIAASVALASAATSSSSRRPKASRASPSVLGRGYTCSLTSSVSGIFAACLASRSAVSKPPSSSTRPMALASSPV
ncbi:MAG: TPR end-of-group domain-containing protein [Terriglobales bacterium]